MKNKIKSNFPFESRYLDVKGSKIHYIDENKSGDQNQITFVCMHGNPTSSFLWRNIIPHLREEGRVIAFDLIGFGKSGKPDIDYKVATHYKYVEAFINGLNLKNIVFVTHDWGLTLGISFARKHEDKIKGLVFMEGPIRPMVWREFAFEPVRTIFRLFRMPIIGRLMNVNMNMFVKKILLDKGSLRKLSNEERGYYSEPFLNKKSRKPVYLFPKFIPINGKPQDTFEMLTENHKWLQVTPIPKLLFWVRPGIIIRPRQVEEMRGAYPKLTDVYLGESAHFIQEDFPHEIGTKISKWYQEVLESELSLLDNPMVESVPIV